VRFSAAADVTLFAESVGAAVAGWEGVLEPEFGTWWDERDDVLAAALAELGWAELWTDGELLPMVVAGAIELGRITAPLCLLDEATLGAPLALGSRVRHGEGRSQCATLSDEGELALVAFRDGRREPTLDGAGTLVAEFEGAAESVADGEERRRTWGAATLGYLAGLADAAVASAVAHASVREQFGAPLGALAAVQGRLAEAALARDGLLLSAWGATDPERAFPAAELAWAGDASREVAAQVIQVHGGIGFALEGGVHRHYRRAKTVQVWTETLLSAMSG
jgi:hypothetical protein